MFCRNCGKQLGPETNFCPACGTKVLAGGEAPYGGASTENSAGPKASTGFPGGTSGASQATLGARPEKLVRPRSPRMLGGVCAAFALHFGWNLDLVRVVTAVLGLIYGVGVLAYLACWIVLPDGQYALPPQSR